MKLRALLPRGRSRREEELDAELAAHLRMAEAERVAREIDPRQGGPFRGGARRAPSTGR